jgi:hypothetical protein
MRNISMMFGIAVSISCCLYLHYGCRNSAINDNYYDTKELDRLEVVYYSDVDGEKEAIVKKILQAVIELECADPGGAHGSLVVRKEIAYFRLIKINREKGDLGKSRRYFDALKRLFHDNPSTESLFGVYPASFSVDDAVTIIIKFDATMKKAIEQGDNGIDQKRNKPTESGF